MSRAHLRGGKVSDGYRWRSPWKREAMRVLAGTDDERADGEDTAQDATAGTPGEETRAEETRAEGLFRQLGADDSPETVEAVRALFACWGPPGGWIGLGVGDVR